MPEIIRNHKVFSLLEITQSLQRAVRQWYPNAYWIKAEMNKLNHYTHSGHCYPDLIERRDGKVVAQIRANLWAGDYQRINEQFIRILKEPLKDGISILFLAKLSFHPVYGMSLVIQDIDPSYTLGDLEREKQETIDSLKSAGIFVQNKSLKLPLLPQRIAIISVETSRGLADFKSVMDNNPRRYRFFSMLFPALLQGDRAVDSIFRQLQRIRKVRQHFDLVAIIRGGGGEVGLSCYNHYRLAAEIAGFPVPVLTGIGHSTNETVSEMVAWKNAITPTDLADFLIGKFHEFSKPVEDAEQIISIRPENILAEEIRNLIYLSKSFKSVTEQMISQSTNLLHHYIRDMQQAAIGRVIRENEMISNFRRGIKRYPLNMLNQIQNVLNQKVADFKRSVPNLLNHRKQDIALQEKQMSLLHPKNVLKRGYSITRINGKTITDAGRVQEGDVLETNVYKGKILSKTISNE